MLMLTNLVKIINGTLAVIFLSFLVGLTAGLVIAAFHIGFSLGTGGSGDDS